jgi:hypothetical protein
MEEWSYTSTHPVGHTGPVTGSIYIYLFINKSNYLCGHNIFKEDMFVTKLVKQ